MCTTSRCGRLHIAQKLCGTLTVACRTSLSCSIKPVTTHTLCGLKAVFFMSSSVLSVFYILERSRIFSLLFVLTAHCHLPNRPSSPLNQCCSFQQVSSPAPFPTLQPVHRPDPAPSLHCSYRLKPFMCRTQGCV